MAFSGDGNSIKMVYLIQIANPSMSLNWLNRRREMAKIISDKYASKDDPIFTGRYTISNPKVSTKKPIKVNKEKILKRRIPSLMGLKR